MYIINKLSISHFKGRVRYFLKVFIPAFILFASVDFGFYYVDDQNKREILTTKLQQSISYQKKHIQNLISNIKSDLIILSTHHELDLTLKTGNTRLLTEEFLSYITYKKSTYDQLRFLDQKGQEK
ncbi:MAG: hypothetical protein OEZ36_04170, partial [Spirochaetota bacterium]|nr:hypothetical protein [Spirochaetota bacterium]